MDKRMKKVLIDKVNALIMPFGCVVTGDSSKSVGVLGDARVRGASLTVRFPEGATHEEIGAISTKIINSVPGITRILMDVEHEDR